MNAKKTLLILLILITVTSSLSMVSAGWFDFLDDGSTDATDTPITLPNNTEEIVIDEGYTWLDISKDEQTRYNGASWYHDDTHSSVSYTSKDDIDMLRLNVNVEFDIRDVPDDSVKSDLLNLTKSSKTADFFTNPSSENGGIYLKFYDKANSTVLTQNIVFTPSDDDNEDYLATDSEFEYDEYTDYYQGPMKEISVHTILFINADSKEGMIDNLKKADRCELHILMTGNGNTDICIPIDDLTVNV